MRTIFSLLPTVQRVHRHSEHNFPAWACN